MSDDSDDPPIGWGMSLLAWLFTIVLHLFFAGLAALGALTINAAIRDWRAGEDDMGALVVFVCFGVVLMVIGLGFFYLAYLGGPRFLANLEARRRKYSATPWLENRQWRARRVVHSIRYTAWFMWFWCICWWVILVVLWSVNKDLVMADLRGSWGQAIGVAAPVAAGLAGLVAAVGLSWRRYRFGDAVLMIDTLPGYLGDRFRGKVLARLGRRMTEPATLTVSCGSLRETRGYSGSAGGSVSSWVFDELWSASHDLHPTQTTFDRGRVTLPVNVELPADLPESGHRLDDPQIIWKLTIVPGSVLDGPLQCEFKIPVFARRDPV